MGFGPIVTGITFLKRSVDVAVDLFPKSQHVLDPHCHRCPDLVASRERIAWGTGSPTADIMVIGEAPGAGDRSRVRWQGGNWTGMAYTTRHSGRRIRQLIEDLGYSDVTYFTNAVKCFPSNRAGSNREPSHSELENCRQHLENEIEFIDPAVLIPTGKHATTSVFSMHDLEFDRFLDRVLEPVDPPNHRYQIIPLLHPSYESVWVSRLGYSRTEYLRRIENLIESCLTISR